jgi:hypothetical protein
MTVRTWRQGRALMASADAELDADALAVAADAARRRWEIPAVPGVLLVDDLAAGRELVRASPDLVADVRQVDGLPNGWAIAWFEPAEPRGADASGDGR